MPAIVFSSILCVLLSILPKFPFWSRSRFALLSAHSNSYTAANEKAATRRRIALLRASEARKKERELHALRTSIQAHEESMRSSSFVALQDRILLWNRIWKLEKELKTLRAAGSTNGRKRQVVAEGGISSSSRSSHSSAASTSRIITGRSVDGSRVSWRAMLSLAMNASESTSNVDLNESVDDIVDEIAQILQARGACIGEGKRKRLASIVEESYASPTPSPPSSPAKSIRSYTSSSSSDSEEGTAVESPTLVHAKLPPPTIVCHDDHAIFSPTHTSPNDASSMYNWIVDQSQRGKEDWGKDVVFEPVPGVPRFSSWNDMLDVHSI